MIVHDRRAGFTLVELLVVTSIFVILLGMVVGGGGMQTTAAGQVRQASQTLASTLVAAQSRALSRPSGAGVVLMPSAASANMSASLSEANAAPFLEGRATALNVAGNGAGSTATVTADIDMSDAYRIQFGGGSPVLSGTTPVSQPLSPWLAFTPPATVSLRAESGQTTDNTPWPPFVPSSGSLVRVARYPTPGSKSFELPSGAGIDLRYSSVGSASWNLADAAGVAIMFDGVGGVGAVMKLSRTNYQIDPLEPTFLLVASRDAIAANTSLADANSLWVVVHPRTGRVLVSKNVPSASLDAARANAVLEITDEK